MANNFYPSEFTTENTKFSGPLAIVSWSGERDGEHAMEGRGRIVFASGAIYEGSVKKDMLHGEGTLTDPVTESVYCGSWVEDRREGQATFTHPFGTYTGGYKNNKRHGKGVETSNALGEPANITVTTTGNWADGELVKGRAVYADGSIYQGEFKDDQRGGLGKLITADGDCLEGEFEDDEFKGSA